MSAAQSDFTGIRWEVLSGSRVVIWSKDRQMPVELMMSLVSAKTREKAEAMPLTGRRAELLATRALLGFLCGREPVTGARGEPLFEDGWAGSISHKSGHVAVWSAHHSDLQVGIDLEARRELNVGVIEKIMAPEERSMCAASDISFGASLIFSAKESIYKALFPVVGKMFYFEAVMLSDVACADDEYCLSFFIVEDLSESARAGQLIRVRAKRIEIDGMGYWLTVAFFPKFRQSL